MSTVKIKTTEGDIIVRLYDETPRHRDNFIKLAKEGFLKKDKVVEHYNETIGKTTVLVKSIEEAEKALT